MATQMISSTDLSAPSADLQARIVQPSTTSMRIRLIGSFAATSVAGDDIAPRGTKAQGLLSYLALQSDHSSTRQRLMGLLWSDRGQAQAQASLRTCLTEIRAAFRRGAVDALYTDRETVALRPELVEVDARSFIHATAHRALAGSEVEPWTGELLTNLEGLDPGFDEWLFFERAALRERYFTTLEKQMTETMARGEWGPAAQLAQAILAIDSASELAHRARILYFAHRGDVGSALRQYESLRQALSRGLEAAPSAETEALIRRVRAGKVGDAPAPAADAVVAAGRAQPGVPAHGSSPSIAVLPFSNISGDPAQDYLADGLTEAIINNLSRFRDLSVIARHSMFAYKGRSVAVPDISQELGVGFVLEGSVQRSGNQVRIVARLSDCGTGKNLWTERYDREVEDIFSVHDEVSEIIVGALASTYGGRLRKAWKVRSRDAERSLEAYDYLLRAIEHADRFTLEDVAQAKVFCAKAIELDPHYGRAIAKMAWLHIFDFWFGWGEDDATAQRRALEFARLAVERDDDEAWSHWALGAAYLYNGQRGRAITEYRKALELNPNDADVMADFAVCLCYEGEAQEACDLLLKAMRLNPHFPGWYVDSLGQAYFDGRRYPEAIAALIKLMKEETPFVYLFLAASHAALGQEAEAREAVAQLHRLDPGATIASMASGGRIPYKNPADHAHLCEMLRRAGLPE